MIFISALCTVLVLSSIAASPIPQDRVEQLKDEITTSVVHDLVIVAKDAKATNMNAKELNTKLLSTTVNAFERMQLQIEELVELSGSSPEVLAKELSRRINRDPNLRDALAEGGELSPRFSGVIGTIGNLSYEIVKGIVHIIIGPT